MDDLGWFFALPKGTAGQWLGQLAGSGPVNTGVMWRRVHMPGALQAAVLCASLFSEKCDFRAAAHNVRHMAEWPENINLMDVAAENLSPPMEGRLVWSSCKSVADALAFTI